MNENKQELEESFQELNNLFRIFVTAKASFRKKDVPQIIGTDAQGDKIIRVVWIKKELDQLEKEKQKPENANRIQSLQAKENSLVQQEEDIKLFYAKLRSLASEIAKHPYISRFYVSMNANGTKTIPVDFVNPGQFKRFYDQKNEKVKPDYLERLADRFEYERDFGAFETRFSQQTTINKLMSGLQ